MPGVAGIGFKNCGGAELAEVGTEREGGGDVDGEDGWVHVVLQGVVRDGYKIEPQSHREGKEGCPGSSSCSWTLEWRPSLRSLRSSREFCFVGLLPKVLAQRTKRTTSFFPEPLAFSEAHEKVLATLATTAKGATESPFSHP